jgi:ABC-type glutathione transport system ATPase component
MAQPKGTADKLKDWLFAHQEELSPATVKRAAAEVGGVSDFDAQYSKMIQSVKTDAAIGSALGVDSTPSFFVNGKRVPSGGVPAAVLRGADRAGAEARNEVSAIRTRALSKDYYVGFWRPRPYRALDNLSIDVEPGAVFGFLGPNGAGKTTTLKLLMQLVFPTSGEAEILGRPVGDVTRPPPHRLPARESVLLRPPDRRGSARLLRPPVRHVRRRRGASGCPPRSIGSASAPNGAWRCASSPRACCSASAWRRRF